LRDARIAIFRAVSTPARRGPTLQGAQEFADESVGARGYVMARINRMLRSAPARIGQRIAQFVAIAAASLPDAGA